MTKSKLRKKKKEFNKLKDLLKKSIFPKLKKSTGRPEFMAFMISGLRRLTYRWIPREDCRREARVERGLYKCSNCGKIVKRMDTKIDHTLPVINPTVGFVDWDNYIKRLFCSKKDFQLLCKSCHLDKTAVERRIKMYIKYKEEHPEIESKKCKGLDSDSYYLELYAILSRDRDITMCRGNSCPIRNSCLRYLGHPEKLQSFFVLCPFNKEKESCEHLLSVE